MIRTQINQASLSMFSRLFRYFRPVQFIQFIFKADHILLKHIVSRKIVLKRCFEMCAIEREVLENDTLSCSWRSNQMDSYVQDVF